MSNKVVKTIILFVIVMLAAFYSNKAGCLYFSVYTESDPSPLATEFLTAWQAKDYKKAYTFVAAEEISKIKQDFLVTTVDMGEEAVGKLAGFKLDANPPLRRQGGIRWYELTGVLVFEKDNFSFALKMEKIDGAYKITAINIKAQNLFFTKSYKDKLRQRVNSYHEDIQAGRFAEAYNYVGDSLKQRSPPYKSFVESYKNMNSEMGGFDHYGELRFTTGGYFICQVNLEIHFVRGKTNTQYHWKLIGDEWKMVDYKEKLAK